MLAPRRLGATGRLLALLAGLAVVAGLVRVVGVGYPPGTLFDELWYARDGCFWWKGSVEACALSGFEAPDRDVAANLERYGELTPEHPPLAKRLIGLPMAVLPYGANAWRLVPLLTGVLTVVLLALLAWRLLGSLTAAGIAGGLLAIDFFHVVHSRLAMLDLFVGAFAVAAILCAVLDREQVLRRVAGQRSHPWWRVLAGVAAGAATASKLPGGAVVVAVLVLTLAWEVEGLRRAGRAVSAAAVVRRLPGIAAIGALAVLTYVLTYAGGIDGPPLAPPWEAGSWLGQWLERQALIVGAYADRSSSSSLPWTLPMTAPPLPYLLRETPDGAIREVLLVGDPLLWWGGFAAVIAAAALLLRRRGGPAELVVVLGFLGVYAAWLSVTLGGRPVHLYYAVPVAPFVCLALAWAAMRLLRRDAAAAGSGDGGARRLGRGVVAGVGVLAVALFAFLAPILLGLPLAPRDWELRACTAQALWLHPVDGCAERTLEPEDA